VQKNEENVRARAIDTDKPVAIPFSVYAQ
jgi:hypothetical protein